MDSADAKLAYIESNGKPDLTLSFRGISNGIGPSESDAIFEAGSSQHPFYTISLGFEMIIGDRSSQSNTLSTLQERSNNQILIQEEQADLQSTWAEQCNELEKSSQAIALMEEKAKLDEERLKILDQDFGFGKTDLSTLLQAEETLSTTKSSLASLSADLYSLAWNLRRKSGYLRTFVESALK